MEYGFEHGIKSFTGLKKHMHRKLREKYSLPPSHYVHTVCQDAAVHIKSFLELRKCGRAYTERPIVGQVSIWLVDHLWRPLGYMVIKVATHRGWIVIELQLHRLYWRHINSGQRLRTQSRLKIDRRERKVYVHMVFEKEVEERKPRG